MASEWDRFVLKSIFNPLMPLSDKPDIDILPSDLTDDDPATEEVIKAKELERIGVELTEKGNLDAACIIFDQAIELTPQRPAGYNNRAQVKRLKGDNSGAMEDLNRAISFSSGKGLSGCQAYCQRGLLHMKEGNEQKAKADYEEAAKLGSPFAKEQLVQMNPYAALCNKMLLEIFDKMRNSIGDEKS